MIPLTRPCFNDQEMKAVSETLSSGWVTQGPKVKEFEQNFASAVGASYACAVSNCTSALQLALLTVNVKPGDIVITASHSFIATANSVRWCGAEPVFIDIDPQTYNISPELLENFLKNKCDVKGKHILFGNAQELVTEHSPFFYIDRTRIGRIAAIMPIHQMGMPCDIKAIVEIAKRYHIPVIEDAACAIGSETNIDEHWEKIGKPHGDIACFSFHPRKIITTGEGGMLTTNNKEYDQQLRRLRHQGMSISDLARSEGKKVVFEKYLMTAFNYRLTDIQAAIGIQQLKKLSEIVKQRRAIAGFYRQELQNNFLFQLPMEYEFCKSNWQSYPIKVNGHNPSRRNEIMQFLLDAGISTRPGIMNSHQEMPYMLNNWNLPESEKARDAALLLPIFPSITEEQLKRIVTTLKGIG